MSSAGVVLFLLLPIYLGAAIEALSLTEEQAGFLSSSYFTGFMVSVISALFWFHRIPFRLISVGSYLLLSAALVSGAFFDTPTLSAVTLLVAGAAAGSLYALGVTIVSSTDQPDRNFGLVLASQQLLAGVLLFTVPGLVLAQWGFVGLNFSLATVTALLGISSVWIPPGAGVDLQRVSNQPRESISSLQPIILGLVALAVYFAALSGVWAFLERLAGIRGLTVVQIGDALAIAMLGGVVGGVGAAIIGARWGRIVPLIVSTIVFVGVLFFYNREFSEMAFVVATLIFLTFWNFILAYQWAIVSELDGEGRYSVLIPAAQAFGAILGPIVAGLIIMSDGYQALLWSTSAVVVVCLVPFLFLQRTLLTTD